MSREAIKKSTRFEVFKRDSFTCQYCGRKAPDVVLHIDHIEPVSKGGGNGIMNLITSCLECNAGKSDRRLNDGTVLEKRRKQLEELQERKEQLEMLMQWQKALLSLERDSTSQAAEYWAELVHPFHLTETGEHELSKLLHKYSITEVLEAMKISTKQYIDIEDGKPTPESVNKAWDYVGRICRMKQSEKEKPYLKDILYIRGILRKRFSYCNEREALELLEQAVESGIDVEHLKRNAKNVRNWSQWRGEMSELLGT